MNKYVIVIAHPDGLFRVHHVRGNTQDALYPITEKMGTCTHVWPDNKENTQFLHRLCELLNAQRYESESSDNSFTP